MKPCDTAVVILDCVLVKSSLQARPGWSKAAASVTLAGPLQISSTVLKSEPKVSTVSVPGALAGYRYQALWVFPLAGKAPQEPVSPLSRVAESVDCVAV